MCFLLTLASCYLLFTLAYPFLIGFALAFLINPLVSFLERYVHFNRTLAVLVSLLMLILLISGFMTFLIAEIIAGSSYLASTIPVHLYSMREGVEQLFFTKIFPIVEQLMALFATLDQQQQETVLSSVKAFTTQLTETASHSIQSLLHSLSQLLISLPNLATVFIFSLLSTFFISKDWHKLTKLFKKVVPNLIYLRTHTILYDIKNAFFGYIRGQFLLISMTCLIVLIGFLFLDIKYPITTALIIAFVDLIPYLGTGLIFLPWIAYSFLTGDTQLASGIAILYCIVLIQRQVFEPRVLSASIGIEPLAMLISIFIGFQLFQLAGLFIGPVLFILVRTIYCTGVLTDLWVYITDQNNTKNR